MAVSELEAVLEFLRRNGFPEAESALREDLAEKGELGSFYFEKFLFPMVPPPPPVRIPAKPEEPGAGNADGSSSDDQFMSLGSSTSDVCSSSDFVNPYGVRSSSTPDSETSSDRMSQFGTARTDNNFDFEMQNDLYSYDEKSDEAHFLTPCFRIPESFPGPAEDKFVMSFDTHMNDDDDLFRVPTKEEGDTGDPDSFDFDPKDQSFDDEKKDPMPAEQDEEGGCGNEISMFEGLEDEEDYEVFELRVVHRKNRTGFEESKDFPIVLNAVVAGRYCVTEYLGSAAFSKVVRAHDLFTGTDVCLKIIKNDKDFFDQSLDEIKLLKLVNKYDPADERHILRLFDYFYHQEHLFIVCELLRANLYEFQKFNQDSGGEPYFTLSRLQVITRQCLEALDYLHSLGILHCDLKPENILIKSYSRTEIKIIDLGSSCFRSDNLCLYVQSRSYRAPEVILGLPYDQKIDIWSLGCILAELCSGEVLFPNNAVVMILARMIGMLGPFDLKMLLRGQETAKYFTEEYDLYYVDEETDQIEYIIHEESSLDRHLRVSDVGFVDFVRSLLEKNPKRRPDAREAMEHPWLSYKY